jgi:hypothetical protein
MRASVLSINDGNLNARVLVLSFSRRAVILLGGIVLKSRNRSWLFLASSLESFFLPAEDRLFSIPPLVGKVSEAPVKKLGQARARSFHRIPRLLRERTDLHPRW